MQLVLLYLHRCFARLRLERRQIPPQAATCVFGSRAALVAVRPGNWATVGEVNLFSNSVGAYSGGGGGFTAKMVAWFHVCAICTVANFTVVGGEGGRDGLYLGSVAPTFAVVSSLVSAALWYPIPIQQRAASIAV